MLSATMNGMLLLLTARPSKRAGQPRWPIGKRSSAERETQKPTSIVERSVRISLTAPTGASALECFAHDIRHLSRMTSGNALPLPNGSGLFGKEIFK